jgi:hypothetical protein
MLCLENYVENFLFVLPQPDALLSSLSASLTTHKVCEKHANVAHPFLRSNLSTEVREKAFGHLSKQTKVRESNTKRK